MKRVLPIIIFIGLAALLTAGLINAPRKEIIPSPLIDKPLPDFTLRRLDQPSLEVARDDLLGQPFLLNVWASWCPGCRDEHQQITTIAASGLVPVYGLNYKDQRSDAQRWLIQFGDPYALTLTDPDGQVGIDLGVYGAPETFLIDHRGIIRYKYIGPLNARDWQQEVQPLVLQLLNEARS
ncbi:MAG: DsbE family thiol:disulfide interchange protein [Wenzhouxiangellaceae bacterium]